MGQECYILLTTEYCLSKDCQNLLTEQDLTAQLQEKNSSSIVIDQNLKGLQIKKLSSKKIYMQYVNKKLSFNLQNKGK